MSLISAKSELKGSFGGSIIFSGSNNEIHPVWFDGFLLIVIYFEVCKYLFAVKLKVFSVKDKAKILQIINKKAYLILFSAS